MGKVGCTLMCTLGALGHGFQGLALSLRSHLDQPFVSNHTLGPQVQRLKPGVSGLSLKWLIPHLSQRERRLFAHLGPGQNPGEAMLTLGPMQYSPEMAHI